MEAKIGDCCHIRSRAEREQDEHEPRDPTRGGGLDYRAGAGRRRAGGGEDRLPDRRRAVQAQHGFAQAVPVSRVVPRRQVRHLGPLGTAGRADGRRLVRPRHVRARQRALQVSPGALRPSVGVRLQGHHPAVEGREVGPRPADGALQEGRREVLRQHGLAPRQLLPLELEAPQVERRQHGPEARRGRRLAEGGARSTACGSASPSTWAPASPGSRAATAPTRPARRPACPTTAPIPSTRTSITSPPSRATRAGTATIPSGSSSGTPRSRNWWTTTIPTCSTPTAACPSATRSA